MHMHTYLDFNFSFNTFYLTMDVTASLGDSETCSTHLLNNEKQDMFGDSANNNIRLI